MCSTGERQAILDPGRVEVAHEATVSYVCVAKVKGQVALTSMVDTCKVLYAMGQQAPRLVLSLS